MKRMGSLCLLPLSLRTALGYPGLEQSYLFCLFHEGCDCRISDLTGTLSVTLKKMSAAKKFWTTGSSAKKASMRGTWSSHLVGHMNYIWESLEAMCSIQTCLPELAPESKQDLFKKVLAFLSGT